MDNILNEILESLKRIERMLEFKQGYEGVSKCAKCNMIFTGTTSYYCSRSDCPTFAKAY